ncbi:MAG: AAA family ATPase [Desulfamplus sp.]|nr:AAA family ATPase [Desulfamplus sp.]
MQKIYKSNNSTVYIGKYGDYSRDVIIKSMNAEYPTEEQITRFANEYEFTKIGIPGVRKALEITQENGRHILVLEYFEGETINEFIKKNNFSLLELIPVGITIAQALGNIHQQKIIHKEINSNNILINKKNEIVIIDFGLATKYTLKTHNLANPDHLEGTLAYISPEQTGRMNRSVDYRTDLYSLGVVLYQLFTKKMPFDDDDKMELIHSHIAKMPLPPKEMKSEIPESLSDTILKLLSKNAEDRYQSAFGLKHDLEVVYESLQRCTEIENFQPGKKDFSGRLNIPEKLYGRENEIRQLFEIYHNVSRGEKDLLLISGFSGTGKSAIVHEIYKPLTQKRGFCIEGKFDQFQKNIPYNALIQAFTDFAALILKENDEKLDYWKNLIQKAVGNVGQFLTSLIPELELVMGKQPELPMLDGKEAQNLFNYAWSSFVKAVSGENHPLVIFIDDLQWADNSSVELLKYLLDDPEIKYLFCIIAYRDNEISSHVLHQFENLSQINISKIRLENLSRDDVGNLVDDTLESMEKIWNFDRISDLVFSKTLGNAFFTVQFLRKLYEEELLTFDFEKSRWRYDADRIEKQNITDNVVELMADKVHKLSEKTQEVLKIAACIGGRFDTEILSGISKSSKETLKDDLEPAIFENLIVPLEKNAFIFAHDRIQQAVYSTIADDKKALFHLQTGRLMLQNFDLEDLKKRIFDVVNQLNHGKELITDESEKKHLAGLNLRAAMKAKLSSAYLPAYNCLLTANELLGMNSWQTDYDFTLQIYDELADLAYLSGRYDDTEKWVEIIIKNADDILHIINAYYVLINSCRAQSKYKEAVEKGVKLLSQLGLNLPLYPSRLYLIKTFIKTQIILGNKPIKYFEKLPAMSDKKQLAVVKLLESLGSSAFLSYPDLFPLIPLEAIKILIKYGNCTNSPYMYSGYSVILAVMNKIDKAVEFGKLGVRLAENSRNIRQKAKVHYMMYYFNMIWKSKLHVVLPCMVEDTYKICLETGDIEFAAYAITNSALYFYCNLPLEQLQNKMKDNLNAIKKTNQEYAINSALLQLQIYETLIVPSWNNCLIKGDYFNEETEESRFIASNDKSNLREYYMLKLILCLFFDETPQSQKYMELTEKYKHSHQGTYQYARGSFYSTLGALQLYSIKKDKRLLNIVKKNKKLMKIWAKNNPVNFGHGYELIAAEELRIRGKYQQAREFYDKAIFGAKENGFLCDEALSWQMAARFYLGINKNHLAKYYMQNAHDCYKNWNAYAVCRHLEEKYPEFSLHQTPVHTQQGSTMTASTPDSSSALDLSSLIKAANSLSGEVKLEKLLKSILQIIMENAGADYAVIIKNDEGKFTIEAKGRHGCMEFLKSEKLEESESVALNIVKFVIRTEKFIVIDDALKNKDYANNEYIQKNRVKSVFCCPIIHKHRLAAVLYLENSLSTYVFTAKRIETVNILSSQIAISIENALLYEHLEEKVDKRTEELRQANAKLEETHKKITDSISYASRIQQALLPSEEDFAVFLPEYFVLNKPRDVVSGDFYYLEKIDKYLIIAAADCTGHGVPGAFVSMLGIAFLNAIIREQETLTAAKLLEELRNKVKTSLKQTAESGGLKDGMDIALCIIDIKTSRLQFAGAYNPLYLIRNNELTEIKATKTPISFSIREKAFQNNEMELHNSDRLYMFSDGYIDQHGGDNRRRFLKKNFKKLLIEISDRPFPEQKQILDKTIESWKNGESQTDDILVVGIKIGG